MSVFNGLPYLQEAIESILGQTYVDFEFIIIDDGSTDGTSTVLSAYEDMDPRVRVLTNEHNLGYTRSLNKGILASRGIYIARQDADDVSHSERLACQVEYLDQHPQVGLVGALPEFIDECGEILPVYDYEMLTSSAILHEALLDRNWIRHGSIMMRKVIVDIVGLYDPSLEPAEDYDLWLRIAEVSQLANLADSFYQYREHPESVSSTRRARQMFNKAQALEQALHRRFGDQPPAENLNILARDYLRSAVLAFDCDEPEFAQCSLTRALEIDPNVLKTRGIECVIRYAPKGSADQTIRYVNRVFDRLFPSTAEAARIKSQLISELHIQQVFRNLNLHRWDHLDEHLWKGLRLRPAWLLNRGVLSLALRRGFNNILKLDRNQLR